MMMKPIQLDSIKTKLTLIITLVTLCMLVAVGVLIVAIYKNTAERGLQQRIDILAKVASQRNVAAVAFSDVEAAEAILVSLAEDSAIQRACIYTADGALFAAYARVATEACDASQSTFTKVANSTYKTLWAANPILFRGKQIAVLNVEASKQEIFEAMEWFSWSVAGIVLLAILFTYLVSLRIQNVITAPILRLSYHARHISESVDYTGRVPISGSDEIASLCESFNEMVAQIQSRATQRDQIESTLRESEVHYRTLVENAPVAIQELDLQGRILSSNAFGADLAGFNETDMLIGMPYLDLVIDGDRAHVERCLARSAAGTTTNFECAIRGGQIHLSSSFVPLFNETGEVQKLIGIAANITERIKTEEGLRRTQKMDAIGQLSGGLAHDFNNILATILGSLYLLKNDQHTSAKSLQHLEMIERAATRASDLTKQLLGFSREKLTRVAVVDLNAVVTKVKDLIERSVTPGIEVIWMLEPGRCTAKIDPGDLEDALLNLVINARDALPEGGYIKIITRSLSIGESLPSGYGELTPGDYTLLEVQDNGIGISRNVQERIFEPFYTTKQEGMGTGLGLAMVFGFAKRSKAFLQVDSEVGKGSIFRLFFPAADSQRVLEDTSKPRDNQLPKGGERILVVDDEGSLLVLAEEILCGLGYKVVTASNGQDALEILKRGEDFRLLFTDVLMPGELNGYQLAEAVLNFRPGIKVLLTSGYTGKLTDSLDMRNIPAEFLRKPYTASELAESVRECLDN